MAQECREGQVQPGSKQYVHWLEDGERFLVDVHWDKFQFSKVRHLRDISLSVLKFHFPKDVWVRFFTSHLPVPSEIEILSCQKYRVCFVASSCTSLSSHQPGEGKTYLLCTIFLFVKERNAATPVRSSSSRSLQSSGAGGGRLGSHHPPHREDSIADGLLVSFAAFFPALGSSEHFRTVSLKKESEGGKVLPALFFLGEEVTWSVPNVRWRAGKQKGEPGGIVV